MKHYLVKTDLGNSLVDVFVLSHLDALGVKARIDADGGVSGPMGWIHADRVTAVLDCAVLGIAPPGPKCTVIPFVAIDGGKDDARGRGEGEASGLPEEFRP